MSKSHKQYVCPHENCNSVFKRRTRYESHLRVHSGERPFICPFDECDKSYTRAFHLNRHMKIHESSFRCSVDGCLEILKSKATLKKHIDLIHKKKRHKIFKCSYCDKEFNKHNWLQKHEYIHTGMPPFLCPADNCERRFLVPSKLKKHMKIHEGYTCTKPDCDKTYLKWSQLVKHNVISHPKVFCGYGQNCQTLEVHKCASCNKEFSRSSNLKEHELVHNEEREVFDCPVPNCIRFYFHKRNLMNHIKSYHEARPFVCQEEHCHKAFKTEADLSKHALRHDPNRPLRKKKKKKTKPKRSFADILAGYESNESENMETVICNDANLEKRNDVSSGSNQLDSLNMTLVTSNSLSETCTDYLQSDVAAYESNKSENMETVISNDANLEKRNDLSSGSDQVDSLNKILVTSNSLSETCTNYLQSDVAAYESNESENMETVICNDANLEKRNDLSSGSDQVDSLNKILVTSNSLSETCTNYLQSDVAAYESNESENMETVICNDANLEKRNDLSSGSDQVDSLNKILVTSNSLSETCTDYLQSDVAAYESNESENMETVICNDANLEKRNDVSSGSDQLDSPNVILVTSNSLSETFTDYLQSDVAAYTTISKNVRNCRYMPIVCTN